MLLQVKDSNVHLSLRALGVVFNASNNNHIGQDRQALAIRGT